jgi:anion-transporting  ArsA/GET3 family ATPase
MSSGPIVPTPVETSIDRLAQRELVVVSGKGGVGRTTMAALLGQGIARRGRRVLIATTGHDDRLAWMLGLDALDATPRRARPGLDVVRLVPNVCLREYGALIVHSDRISGAVFDNRIVRRLFAAIPGLDDFAVLGKAWHEAARGNEWDTVVFDGPATGHLLYTLGVPRAIMSAMPPGPLTAEAKLMDECLTDPSRAEAVLVGLPETWPLTELAQLGRALRRDIGISVETIVVNGVWPLLSASAQAALDARGRAPDASAEYLTWLAEIADGGRRHAEAVRTFAAGPQVEACDARELVVAPWRFAGIRTPQQLEALAAGTTPPSHASGAADSSHIS